jgi:UDP-GlcNAc:undecaprenyl-phosphate/decaprenyl-phosphate GlcNAc-1-phosphate transferase
MSFPLNFCLAALAGSLVTVLLILPPWRQWCRRTGHVDDPGHRKIHHTPVPLAGGPAVLTGVLLPLLAGAVLLKLGMVSIRSTGLIVHGVNRRAMELGGIALGAVAITVLGWLDDRMELKPLVKFAGQFLIAFGMALVVKRITLFVPSELFSYAITVFWIVAVINAFNFMDNMNGLCTGLGVIGALLFGGIAARDGEYLVALIAFLTAGALLGFLPYNFPRATAFLGDAGSHLVGYLLAVLAILPHFYTKTNPHPWAVLSPLLVLAVPLADLACMVVIRTRAGKPFWVGDTNHLSHRLVRAGLSRAQAVVVIWGLAVVIGALALAL